MIKNAKLSSGSERIWQIHNSRLQDPAPKLHPLSCRIETPKHQKQSPKTLHNNQNFLAKVHKTQNIQPLNTDYDKERNPIFSVSDFLLLFYSSGGVISHCIGTLWKV